MSGTTYHLRPASGWLNDPNGMVRWQDRWHVFFQHNPARAVHAQIAWGHASSPDLVRWTEHPVAFGPTEDGPDSAGCWTGCFFPGLERPAVVYTGVRGPHGTGSSTLLRWGSDDLMEWGEPVVVAEDPGQDDVVVQRDPFLLELGGRRWAALGAGLGDGTPAVTLYSVEDPLSWRYAGVLTSAHDSTLYADALPSDVWECPQLVRLGDAWALVLSMHDRGVLGPVAVVLGDLAEEGGRPVWRPRGIGRLDVGGAFYAPQVADDGGRHPWLMGWVVERDHDPEVRHQAGCMTLPRRMVQRDGRVSLVVDPDVARALTEGAPERELGPGEHVLTEPVRLRAGAGTELVHAGTGTRLRCVDGDDVWVDGPVLELYPADGSVPSTYRDDEPWTLVVPADGGQARCRAVRVPHSEATDGA